MVPPSPGDHCSMEDKIAAGGGGDGTLLTCCSCGCWFVPVSEMGILYQINGINPAFAPMLLKAQSKCIKTF